MVYRAEQVETQVRPDSSVSHGVATASSETAARGFNESYRQATTANRSAENSLPGVTFVNGGDSYDYPAVQTGLKSFSLGVDKIDIRNSNLQEIGEKFEGIGIGLANTLVGQISAMAADSNYVNKGIAQLGDAVNTAAKYYSDKVSTGDWNGFTQDIQSAGASIKKASDAYSQSSPEKQGEVIGSVMTAFLPVPALFRDGEMVNDATKANRLVKDSADLIEGVRKNGDKPPFLQFAENLGEASRKLTAREREYMQEHNIRIKGVDSISQVSPKLGESALGLCRPAADGGIEIFVSGSVDSKHIDYILRHEFGHAFDRTFLSDRSISSLPGFEAAFQKDVANLSQGDQAILRRYCADTVQGRRETLASLYAHSMDAATDIKRELLLKEKFPNTFKWVKGLVEAFKNDQI
jgi:hypothetical protein